MWYPILIAALTAYLLGNLNGAVCISSLIAKEDVRSQGSGNAGLTNFIRNYGVGGSLMVVAIDVGKTAFACISSGLILAQYGYYEEGLMLGAVAVSLGHDFPALLGFRGGKGILCGFTVALVIDWRIAVALLVVFLIAYLATKYVSLGSILGAVVYLGAFPLLHHDKPLVMWGGVFMGVLALVMHRKNIVRLIKGEESKTYLKKGQKS